MDFLKVHRFSFSVATVGPSVKDFYSPSLPRAKFTAGFFLFRFYPITNGFHCCAVNQARSRHMKRNLSCFDQNSN